MYRLHQAISDQDTLKESNAQDQIRLLDKSFVTYSKVDHIEAANWYTGEKAGPRVRKRTTEKKLDTT